MDFSSGPELDAAAHAADEPDDVGLTAAGMIDLMLTVLADELDHPELWPDVARLATLIPGLSGMLAARIGSERAPDVRLRLCLLLGLANAASAGPERTLADLVPLAAGYSQSPLVQGVIFHLNGLAHPDDPRYRLEGRICEAPFQQLDVLERSSHQCCASWLHTSAGDLSVDDWQDVWNSPNAQAVRESIHDGSYRHCNKMACPKIQAGDLPTADEIAARSAAWRHIVDTRATALAQGPALVNLAYDRTCNLSCPSCRTEKWAADEETRVRFDEMQRRAILPMLEHADTVFVTGSGDPFASKNFRRLMMELDAERYPRLGFQIMTNAMLFTEKQWAQFPALHGRVRTMKISIDAAHGPTHELLRRGARWPVMLENMAFAGRLRAEGKIDHVELVFTVQAENFAEMGDAVDLMDAVGASGIYFARLTNWGTFSDAVYQDKAVFLPSHPDHAVFLEAMQDERLRRYEVLLGDLGGFVSARPTEQRRRFAY